MKELSKDQVELLINHMNRRIENCRRKAKAYALEGKPQMSMIADVQEAEVETMLAYLKGIMQEEE